MTGPDEAATATTPARFPCEQCGAGLAFSPGTTQLVCPYCGHDNEIPEQAVETWEQDYRAKLAEIAAAAPVEDRHVFKCQGCRAEVTPASHVSALACPFCGADLIEADADRRLVRPTLLAPFHVTREAAWTAYRAWVTSRWFAPTEMKRYARSEYGLQGLYVPYWTYDSETTSRYTGMRGDHYWVTVGSGKNRRRVRRTRWRPAGGTVRNTFDDLLVLGSRSLPRKHADRLEPWDLEALVPHDEAYLAGFNAESYQIDLEEGFGIACGLMEPVIRATIRSDIGGDTQQIHSVQTEHDAITYKHVLLPVWTSSYRYRDRVYRLLINGRTGEVQGERPWSWVKIVLAVLGGLAAAAVAALVIAAIASR